jgi:hypothetical protein
MWDWIRRLLIPDEEHAKIIGRTNSGKKVYNVFSPHKCLFYEINDHYEAAQVHWARAALYRKIASEKLNDMDDSVGYMRFEKLAFLHEIVASHHIEAIEGVAK